MSTEYVRSARAVHTDTCASYGTIPSSCQESHRERCTYVRTHMRTQSVVRKHSLRATCCLHSISNMSQRFPYYHVCCTPGPCCGGFGRCYLAPGFELRGVRSSSRCLLYPRGAFGLERGLGCCRSLLLWRTLYTAVLGTEFRDELIRRYSEQRPLDTRRRSTVLRYSVCTHPERKDPSWRDLLVPSLWQV